MKIKHNPKGYTQLLNDPAVVRELQGEAALIEAKLLGEYRTFTEVGGSRARVALVTADVDAMIEAEDGDLLAAVVAGAI